MKKALVISSLAALMATPAVAAPWVRSYVISNYEPATYYGGRVVSTVAPGTDCPKGTNPDNNYNVMLRTPWRSESDIKRSIPEVDTATVSRIEAIDKAISHRSFREDISTYINPFTAPDPGMQQVTGKIAEGFNLDGNAKTGGFTNPQGERGVDNQLYRAWGCTMSYRGTPYHAYLNARSNDKMLDGLYTMVVRISGNEDPMNDKHAVVEVGYSPDHVVKDSAADVTSDYSFRIAKSEQYTKLNAVIKDGVVDTEQVDALHVPDYAWYESNRGDVVYQKGKLRLWLTKDGAMNGLVGGYLNWRDVWAHGSFNRPSGASMLETYLHEDRVGLYYSLKRNADGIPDPKTGQMTGISAAFRFTAVPAFVVDGVTPVVVNEPENLIDTDGMVPKQRAAFLKATTTMVIQKDPEEVSGRRRGYDQAPPAAQPAGKSLQQVNNGAPANTVASVSTQ